MIKLEQLLFRVVWGGFIKQLMFVHRSIIQIKTPLGEVKWGWGEPDA
jgi:hypothetical protein